MDKLQLSDSVWGNLGPFCQNGGEEYSAYFIQLFASFLGPTPFDPAWFSFSSSCQKKEGRKKDRKKERKKEKDIGTV